MLRISTAQDLHGDALDRPELFNRAQGGTVVLEQLLQRRTELANVEGDVSRGLLR